MDALISSIPGIGNVLIVTGLVYLIFGIVGVNLFMGRLWYCEDALGNQMGFSVAGMDAVDTMGWCNHNADRKGLGSHWILCPDGAAAALPQPHARSQRAAHGRHMLQLQ